MEYIPIGAIVAANSLNGDRLKVVIIGERGTMRDVDCRFMHDKTQCANLPESLPLPGDTRTRSMRWTEGGIVDTAHPYSKLAVCTVERFNLACFFYQLPDGRIVMRRCGTEPEWKWESNYIPVLSADGHHSPNIGTSIVIQPSVLRASDDTSLTLFYQTTCGYIGIQKLTDSGELHGPLFQGRLSIPRFTPFTALTSGNKFTISYITLGTQEIWECSGSVSDVPWREFEDDEYYISAAQRLVLESIPASGFVQMASYQAEYPIFCCMTSSPLKNIVWSSAQARRSYYFEDRGMPRTPIALSGWASMRSSLIILFVDIHGAVNVGRFGSEIAGRTKPDCFPIPLESMRNAFSWVLSGGVDFATKVNPSLVIQTLHPCVDSPCVPLRADACTPVGIAKASICPMADETTPLAANLETMPACSTKEVSKYMDTTRESSPECNQTPPKSYTMPCADPCPDPCPDPFSDSSSDSCTEPYPGPCTDSCTQKTECDEKFEGEEGCNGDENPCSPGVEPSTGEVAIGKTNDDPCGESDTVYDYEEEDDSCCEDILSCLGEQPCEEDASPCGEEEPSSLEITLDQFIPDGYDQDSSYGLRLLFDGNEWEDTDKESPADEACRAVAAEDGDICNKNLAYSRSPDETCGDTCPLEDAGLSEGSISPTCLLEIPLPILPPVALPILPSDGTSTPLVPLSPTPGTPYSQELSELAPEPPNIMETSDCVHTTCESFPGCKQSPTEACIMPCPNPCPSPCPNPCSDPCSDPCPGSCAQRTECDGISEGGEECNADESPCSPVVEGSKEKAFPCEADCNPCSESEAAPVCDEEDKSCREYVPLCSGKQICEEVTPRCGEEPSCPDNTLDRSAPKEVDLDLSREPFPSCDVNEGEDAGSESPSDEECETVVGAEGNTCNESRDRCQPLDDAGPFEDVGLSGDSTTPACPVQVHLPVLSPAAVPTEDTPTSPSASLSPIPSTRCSPELTGGAPRSPIIDENKSFIDVLYDRLRFVFKPSGGRYISLQLPARRLDQVTAMYTGTDSTSNEFNSTVISELNFKLSEELFDAAKFVLGPNGKSLSQEYEKFLYTLIPSPDIEVNRRLKTQREIICRYMLEQGGNGSTSRSSEGSSPATQVFDMLRSEARQDVPLGKSTRLALESAIYQSSNVTSRHRLSNSMSQATVPNTPQFSTGSGSGLTPLKLLSHPSASSIQDGASFAGASLVSESVPGVHVRALTSIRMHAAKELMAYLDVKTSSEWLYDAKVTFRESGLSSMYESGPVFPVIMRPVDWYEMSQTSWNAGELNQDLVTLQTQTVREFSDMDSLTTQLLSFIPTNTEDFQKLEIEIQKLIKERDSIQQTLQSEYPSSIISGSNAPAPNPSGSNLDTVLRREHKVTSNDDSRASTDSIANQLGALKVAERRLLVATHSLAVKRARAAMANPDGPNMKIKSMLEAKILEHQAFLEARMKSAQLSAERHALKLQSPIAQVHLPPSDDPRWSVVSISTEVPNATSEDPATGFGLWTGWAKSSVCSVGAVKLDISFRVSIVKADRGDWFKPEFMNHSSQYMRLPGGERWSEWPCNVQTPEQMVERIILGEIEPKGCLPTLPVGYLVAKDILIKVHTSEQPGSISKQDLVKQAAIANGILGFSFAPQASAHGNSGALHINEYSDGIVFRLPDAQILGYLMELTPPDHCADYDADLADSNLKILVDNDHHVETSRNTRADTCNCHCHRSS